MLSASLRPERSAREARPAGPAARALRGLAWLALLLSVQGCALLQSGTPAQRLSQALRSAPDNVDRCQAGTTDSLVAEMEDADAGRFVRELLSGRLEPALWGRCADFLLADLPAPRRAALLDSMGRASRQLLRDSHLDDDPQRQARLDQLHATLLERPAAAALSPSSRALLGELDQALRAHRLGPTATRRAAELLRTLGELERGTWRGARVTTETLDRVFHDGDRDEPLLRRFARRLPDPALREYARRLIARLHILKTPLSAHRTAATAAEQLLLETGRNPLPPDELAVMDSFFDEQGLPVEGFEVQQQTRPYRATLVAQGTAPTDRTVRLRGRLRFAIQGLPQWVPLCPPKRADDLEMDPTPCVAPDALQVADSPIQIGPDGVLTFPGELDQAAVARLATAGDGLRVRLLLRGAPLRDIKRKLRFLPPPESQRAITAVRDSPPGAPGPDLLVDADYRALNRVALTIQGAGEPYFVVAERGDLHTYSITTRGAPGAPGAAGRPGSSGLRGQDGQAQCPGAARGALSADGGPGWPGGPGGDGAPGGPGGDSGRIVVRIRPGVHDFEMVQAELGAILHSEAGPGGEGGAAGEGGPGGLGGRGGPGQKCPVPVAESSWRDAVLTADGVQLPTQTLEVPPGRDGPRGQDGARGRAGPRGRDGRAVPPSYEQLPDVAGE